jgi:hypothetical protein
MLGTLVLAMLIVASMGPQCSASYENKSELGEADETYYDVEGPEHLEEKEENRTGGGGSGGSNESYSTSVDVLRKGSSSMERDSVVFPYQRYNWSIGSWYRTSHGLRFYDIYYNEEKILYDYQLPWVKINGMRYDLTSAMRTDGPDLYVYTTVRAFKVWVEYRIASEDVDVEVYVYFFDDGEMDPWANVDGNDVNRNIVVGQRFDFDLDGAGDDNAEFYKMEGWDLVEEEDDHADDGNPEIECVQWRLFDTDVLGEGFYYDQVVSLVPYHPDDSYLYIVRYHSNQVRGDPVDYDNDEATGLYSTSTYDHYTGYDLVAWYVSEYTQEDWCNPGPWVLVEV